MDLVEWKAYLKDLAKQRKRNAMRARRALPEYRRAEKRRLRRWLKSPEGQAYLARKKSPEGRAAARAAGVKWRQSPEGQAWIAANPFNRR